MMKSLPPMLAVALSALLVHTAALAGLGACTTAERDIWSCEANGKFYTICASNDLGPDTGYMQYRVYQRATQEFAYPATPQHPKGLFKLNLLPRGAALQFKNEAYVYVISEPLAGATKISVRKGSQHLASVNCTDYSDTLTLTSTLNFFATLGIYDK